MHFSKRYASLSQQVLVQYGTSIQEIQDKQSLVIKDHFIYVPILLFRLPFTELSGIIWGHQQVTHLGCRLIYKNHSRVCEGTDEIHGAGNNKFTPPALSTVCGV